MYVISINYIIQLNSLKNTVIEAIWLVLEFLALPYCITGQVAKVNMSIVTRLHNGFLLPYRNVELTD